jgi:NADH dehydrogenase
MPVVVTGASGLVGPYAIAALVRVSPEVRAYVRRPETAEDLRRLGAKVAVGWIDDVDTLTAVMSGAHTLCHLVGAPTNPDPAVHREVASSVQPVLAAALASGIVRVLALSMPGASPEAADARLRSAAAVESAVESSGLEFAVVRCSWIYGRGSQLLEALRTTGPILGPPLVGGGTVAPVFAGDVAAVLAAADDRADLRSGIWRLGGPDRVTMDEFASIVTGSPVRTPRRRRGLRRGKADEGPADLGDDDRALPDAAAEFGVVLTPLADGVARSLGSEPGA